VNFHLSFLAGLPGRKDQQALKVFLALRAQLGQEAQQVPREPQDLRVLLAPRGQLAQEAQRVPREQTDEMVLTSLPMSSRFKLAQRPVEIVGLSM
jgi:hypothetical protein